MARLFLNILVTGQKKNPSRAAEQRGNRCKIQVQFLPQTQVLDRWMAAQGWKLLPTPGSKRLKGRTPRRCFTKRLSRSGNARTEANDGLIRGLAGASSTSMGSALGVWWIRSSYSPERINIPAWPLG